MGYDGRVAEAALVDTKGKRGDKCADWTGVVSMMSGLRAQSEAGLVTEACSLGRSTRG